MSINGLISEGKHTKRYADYVQRCKERGVDPVSFRVWAKADDEYEREWEIANYEYEHADGY